MARSNSLPTAFASFGICSKVVCAQTLSSAFSGVDTPGLAFGVISRAISDLLESKEGVVRPVPTVPHIHGIEWDPHCVDELAVHPHGPCCIYGDINEFWSPSLKPWIQKVMSTPTTPGVMEALRPSVMSGNAMCLTAYCHRHKKQCKVCTATTHVAGTPCTDESMMGRKTGAFDGRTAVFLLAWIGMRRALQDCWGGSLNSLSVSCLPPAGPPAKRSTHWAARPLPDSSPALPGPTGADCCARKRGAVPEHVPTDVLGRHVRLH